MNSVTFVRAHARCLPTYLFVLDTKQYRKVGSTMKKKYFFSKNYSGESIFLCGDAIINLHFKCFDKSPRFFFAIWKTLHSTRVRTFVYVCRVGRPYSWKLFLLKFCLFVLQPSLLWRILYASGCVCLRLNLRDNDKKKTPTLYPFHNWITGCRRMLTLLTFIFF